METNPNGNTSTEPKEFKVLCIRDCVAEVRRKDWKKCGVIIRNEATGTITDRPFQLASTKLTYCQNESIMNGENDKPEDAVNNINDGSPNASSSKLNDDVQSENEDSISEETIDAGTENYMDIDDDEVNTISDGSESYPEGMKSKKYRLLSDIMKEVEGPCDALTSHSGDIVLSSETEEDSDDDFTLETVSRKKKGVRVSSKGGDKSKKNKKRISEVPKRSSSRTKRMKPVSENSGHTDAELGSKHQLRKTRNRSAEIIVHENKAAPSSLGSGEDTDGAQEDSLIKHRNKSTRHIVKLRDGSQMCSTEENSSGSGDGVKSTQMVQSTVATLKRINTASSSVQKSTRESSPTINNESMATLQLIRLFRTGVNIEISFKTATKDPA